MLWDFYNEVGRRFALGSSSMLTPYFGITVAHAEIDGFTEKDPFGTGAALRVASSDADSVATALGLRYNGSFGAFKPQVAVAWEHEFEDTFRRICPSSRRLRAPSSRRSAPIWMRISSWSRLAGPMR